MIAPRGGLTGKVLVTSLVILTMAACGGSASSPSDVDARAGDLVTPAPVATATLAVGPANDTAEASQPASSSGGDCAALTDAAAGVQLWVTSMQAVTSDAQWQQLVANVNFGHAGNGNIHVNLLVNPDNPDEMVRAERCLDEIFDLVVRLRGTLSGEHGVGSEKRAYVGKEIDVPTMALMKEIKQVFDPRNILNPGKLFPVFP